MTKVEIKRDKIMKKYKTDIPLTVKYNDKFIKK